MEIKAQAKSKKSFLLRSLDTVERVGNSLPHPATIFIILTAVVILGSAIASSMGLSVSYDAYDQATGAIVETQVVAESLLSPDGIRYMFTSIVSNFTSFCIRTSICNNTMCWSCRRNRIFISSLKKSSKSYTKEDGYSYDNILGNNVKCSIIYWICCISSIRSNNIYEF